MARRFKHGYSQRRAPLSNMASGTIEERLTGYLNPSAFVPHQWSVDGSTGWYLGLNVFRPFQQTSPFAKTWTIREGQGLLCRYVQQEPSVFDKPSITN
jgi:hypothetical protein